MTSFAERAAVKVLAPRRGALQVDLGYDDRDPWAVTLHFVTNDVTWTMSRDVLCVGLDGPAGLGDVHVWPMYAGITRTLVVSLDGDKGSTVVEFRHGVVRRFLAHTYGLVPSGSEQVDVDGCVASILAADDRRLFGGESS